MTKKGILRTLFDTVLEFNERLDDDDYEIYNDICDDHAHIGPPPMSPPPMECMEFVDDYSYGMDF